MKWSKEEELKAVELLKCGSHSFGDIALILERTKKSIKEKFRRLGFKESDYYTPIYHEEKECLHCKLKFKSLVSDERKYCSKTCAAKTNNTLRVKKSVIQNEEYNRRKRNEYHKRKNKKCLNCGMKVNNKYCSPTCQSEFKWQQIISQIEGGDTTLYYRRYKRYLIEKHGENCMDCGWGETNIHSGSIPIELEHIDGDSTNNSLDNLKLLCPNCHSLTPTFKNLNRGNGRHSRRTRYQDGKSY